MKLVLSSNDDFFDIYSDMKIQFPVSELNEYSVYHHLLLSDKYKLYLAKENGKIIGYILLCDLIKEKFLWIDYISVFKTYQSQGYGQKIFKCLSEKYNSYKGVYLEVEKPNEYDLMSLRRIKFYKKLGAIKLDFEYFYPNKSGCIPMDLYYLPICLKQVCNEEAYEIIKKIFNSIHSHHKHMYDVLNRIIV